MKHLPIFRSFVRRGVGASSRRPNYCGTSRAKAQRAAAAGPVAAAKVAVIAFQAAVSQTNEFQRDFADLQKKYDPRRQQLKTLNDEIDTPDQAVAGSGHAVERRRAREPRPHSRRQEEAAGPRHARTRRATSRATCSS